MADARSLEGRVALVTGSGRNIGRATILELASRGADVVTNARSNREEAESVAQEARDLGVRAAATVADVADQAQVNAMVSAALNEFGRVDILVNNAGILRDKSFAKMDLSDFAKVLDVHLMGTVNCCKAVWTHMAAREYGRIVVTTSCSGMYGNFGQSNYGAAKAGVVGLMNTLAIEGAKKNIKVNTLAPTAATRMTEALLTPETLELLQPETITPGLLALVAEDAPTKMVLGAGGGCFAEIRITETQGVALVGDDLNVDGVVAAMGRIRDPEGAAVMDNAFSQTRKYARMGAAARGLPLPWNE